MSGFNKCSNIHKKFSTMVDTWEFLIFWYIHKSLAFTRIYESFVNRASVNVTEINSLLLQAGAYICKFTGAQRCASPSHKEENNLQSWKRWVCQNFPRNFLFVKKQLYLGRNFEITKTPLICKISRPQRRCEWLLIRVLSSWIIAG